MEKVDNLSLTINKIVLVTVRYSDNPSYRLAEETLARIVFNKLGLKYSIIEYLHVSEDLESENYTMVARLPFIYFNKSIISSFDIPQFLLRLTYCDHITVKSKDTKNDVQEESASKENIEVDQGEAKEKSNKSDKDDKHGKKDEVLSENKEMKDMKELLAQVLSLSRDLLRNLNERVIFLNKKDQLNNNQGLHVYQKSNIIKEIIQNSISITSGYQSSFSQNQKLDSYKEDSLIANSINRTYQSILKIKNDCNVPFIHLVIYSFLKDDSTIYSDYIPRKLGKNVDNSQNSEEISESAHLVLVEIKEYHSFIEEQLIRNKSFHLCADIEIINFMADPKRIAKLTNAFSIKLDTSKQDKQSHKKEDLVEIQTQSVFWHNFITLGIFFSLGLLIYFTSNRKAVATNSRIN